jgi:pimeloyl-ACP methyl ester carboxylesterase
MKLNYKKYGEGENTLIILHGLFGSLDNWQSLGKKFGEHFTTYIVDQRNHGKSPHLDSHNYQDMANDLDELLDDINVEYAFIIGHSMGGKTAMQFSIEQPHRVRKLIIVDIAPKYYAPHHQDIISALESIDFNVEKDRKQVQEKIAQKINNPGIIQFLMKGLTWVTKEQLGWKFNLKVLSAQIENIGEKLTGHAYFTNPTLFIKGEKSDYITEDDIDIIEDAFPMASHVTIGNAGHWLHAENPNQFFDEVITFLK